LWLLAAMCAAAGLGAGPATAAVRVALVIGNSDYKHTRVLPNPRHDAEAIAALLRQIGFAAGDIILKTDLDYRALREAVRAFAAKAAGADTALVYYAGHGIEVGGENYLVPVDAKLARDRDLEYEAVTLASVLDAVGEARRLKLVILDACRDNPLAHKMDLRAGIARQVSRGLERFEPKGDVLVAYAARAGTVALDGSGKHSPYAEALLKHMPTPGIDVFRLFGRVSEAVLDATGRQQEPWLYGRPGGEAVALVPKATPELVLPPLPPPPGVRPSADGLEAAVRICRDVAGIASLSVLGAMADQYKGSTAGPCIAARIEELTRAEAQAKAEAEKKAQAERKIEAEKRAEAQRKNAEAEKKLTVVAPPKRTDPPLAAPLMTPGARPASAPATECDHLAATPGYVTGVRGVMSSLLDATRAVPACREAVAKHPGEARLQAWLGRSLAKAESWSEARLWYEKAAERGHPVALNNLGNMYSQGKVVPQDYAKARSLFEKAADAGEPIAMGNLGLLFRDGRGVPQDYATARVWLEKAAEKGVPGAMSALGVLYHNGQGVQQNHVTARVWYEKAAETGEPIAMRNLGLLFRDGRGVPQDYATARVWLEKAAEKGVPGAMSDVGWLYFDGKGVRLDYAQAFGWFQKAAERDYVPAMADLGWLYQSGHGAPLDYASARRWYEKAAALGNRKAMTNIGVLFHNGLGVQKSYVVARGWYEKAVEKGDPFAMRNLAILLSAGKGVARSPQLAARHLLAAARRGNVSSRRDLDGDMRTWPPDTRAAVQELLIASGDYRGRRDGNWGQASRDAVRAYYSRRD
jgi:TPR repeat protein